MTPLGARLIAQRKTREHLSRKHEGQMATHEVDVIVPAAHVVLRVQADSQDEAEEQAVEQVSAMLPAGMEADEPYVHATRTIPAQPATEAR